MLKITSLDSDTFEMINNAISLLNPSDNFLSYFDKVEQYEKDKTGITVIIRNIKKFKKDLNKRKYIISIPEKLIIDSVEYLASRHAPQGCRRLSYTAIINGHVEEDENNVNFIFILGGFNDSNIRLIKEETLASGINGSTTGAGGKCLCGSRISPSDNLDALNQADIDDAVDDLVHNCNCEPSTPSTPDVPPVIDSDDSVDDDI